MFPVHCPRHGHEVLLGHRQIVAIDGSGPEITVRWTCYCGHQGSHQPQARVQLTGTPAATVAA